MPNSLVLHTTRIHGVSSRTTRYSHHATFWAEHISSYFMYSSVQFTFEWSNSWVGFLTPVQMFNHDSTIGVASSNGCNHAPAVRKLIIHLCSKTSFMNIYLVIYQIENRTRVPHQRRVVVLRVLRILEKAICYWLAKFKEQAKTGASLSGNWPQSR